MAVTGAGELVVAGARTASGAQRRSQTMSGGELVVPAPGTVMPGIRRCANSDSHGSEPQSSCDSMPVSWPCASAALARVSSSANSSPRATSSSDDAGVHERLEDVGPVVVEERPLGVRVAPVDLEDVGRDEARQVDGVLGGGPESAPGTPRRGGGWGALACGWLVSGGSSRSLDPGGRGGRKAAGRRFARARTGPGRGSIRTRCPGVENGSLGSSIIGAGGGRFTSSWRGTPGIRRCPPGSRSGHQSRRFSGG